MKIKSESIIITTICEYDNKHYKRVYCNNTNDLSKPYSYWLIRDYLTNGDYNDLTIDVEIELFLEEMYQKEDKKDKRIKKLKRILK